MSKFSPLLSMICRLTLNNDFRLTSLKLWLHHQLLRYFSDYKMYTFFQNKFAFYSKAGHRRMCVFCCARMIFCPCDLDLDPMIWIG